MQKLGLGLFCAAWIIFNICLGLDNYKLTEELINADSGFHIEAIKQSARDLGILNKEYHSGPGFIQDFKKVLIQAQSNLTNGPIPDGVNEWDYRKLKITFIATCDLPSMAWFRIINYSFFS